MNNRTISLLTFLSLILFSGCAERQSPNSSSGTGSLALQSRTPVRGQAEGVAVVGDTAYVADRGYGISLYDLTDPAHPLLVDSLATETPFDMSYLAVDPTARIACTQGTNSLEFYDLQNKVTLPMFTGSKGHFKIQLSYDGDTLKVYRTDRNLVDGFLAEYYHNTGTPEQPVFGFAAFVCNYIGGAYGFSLAANNHAWVTLQQLGVVCVDYSTPSLSPPVISQINTPGLTTDAAIAGNYLYLASGYEGLLVLNVSNPAAPYLVGSLALANSPDIERVAVQGNRAYLLDTYDGVFAVDISNPANPMEIGSLSASTAIDFTVSGDLVVIADEDAGLIVAQILY
jgi:hypothetical protein